MSKWSRSNGRLKIGQPRFYNILELFLLFPVLRQNLYLQSALDSERKSKDFNSCFLMMQKAISN